MPNVGSVYVPVKTDLKGLDNGLTKAHRKVTSAATKMENALNKAFKVMGVAAVAGAAVAVYQVQKVARESIKAASDLEEVASKFDVVFAGQTKRAEEWSRGLVESYGLSTRASKEYLASVQDLLKPMGMAADAAAEMSNEVVQLAIDLGSFNNMPTADVMMNIKSALVGEYESMRKYGVVLNATIVQQKALTMGLAKTKDELTYAHRAQAAYTMMVEGSKDAIGDWARTSESYANQMKQLTSQIEDQKAKIGDQLLPVVTDWISQTNQLIKANEDLIAQNLPAFLEKIISAMWAAVEVTRFFYNAWKGLLLGANLALEGIAYMLEKDIQILRSFLEPLDLIFERLKKLGAIDVNPFDVMEEGIGAFRASSADVTKNIIADIEETNTAYDKVTGAIENMKESLNKAGESSEKSAGSTAANTAALTENSDALVQNVKELEKRKKALEDLLDAQVDFYNSMLAEGIAITEEMEKRVESMDEWELGQYERVLKEKYDMATDAAQDQQNLLQDQQNAAQQTYSNMASFFRDALTQMVSDTGSFTDMIIAKLKNLAASIASNVLASVASSVMSAIPGMGGGQGGGMNLMSILSGGKTGYNMLGGMGSLYGPSVTGVTPLPAGMHGPPAPIYGINWMGAGAGVLGMAGGGYGMYSAYQSGDVGMGALSGAAFGLGGVTLAASGALGGTMAGAAGGSWAGPIGMAVGAIIGTAIGMMGKKSADAEERRVKRAETYYSKLEHAATDHYDSLEALMANRRDVSGAKNVYAAVEYGGLEGAGVFESLYGLGEMAERYGDIVELFGDTSTMTLSTFKQASREMDNFTAASAAWSGNAKAVAEQWQAAWEKAKALQLKAVLDEINEGMGNFSANIKKIELLELDQAEEDAMKYNAAMQLLTSEHSALIGELSKARDILKETGEAIEELANAEKGAAIKLEIFRSELELTEGQLRALKFGDVNVELIELYTALGWVDREIVILKDDTQDASEIIDELKSVLDETAATVAHVAGMFEGFEGAEKFEELYLSIQYAINGLKLMLDTIDKLQALPEVLKDAGQAIRDLDLAEFNAQLMTIADTFLQVSESIGVFLKAFQQVSTVTMQTGEAMTVVSGGQFPSVEKLGQILAIGGGILTLFGLIVEAGLAVIKVWQNFLSILAETERWSWFVDMISDMRESFIEFVAWFIELWGQAGKIAGERFREAAGIRQDLWKESVYGAEPITTTLEGAGLVDTSMTLAQAEGIYQGYADQGKYAGMNQIEIIESQAAEAIQVLGEEIWSQLSEAYPWQKALKDYNDMINRIEKGSAEAAATVQEQWDAAAAAEAEALAAEAEALKQSIKVFLDPLQDIINTAGKSDFEKSIYNLNKWYEDQKEIADDLGVSLGELNAAYAIQARDIIDNFWNPVIQGIQDQINSLQFGSFNLAPGAERAVSAQAEYARLKGVAMAASGEDKAGAIADFQAFLPTYLQEMQDTFKSSSTYLDAFADAQETLAAFAVAAESERDLMLDALGVDGAIVQALGAEGAMVLAMGDEGAIALALGTEGAVALAVGATGETLSWMLTGTQAIFTELTHHGTDLYSINRKLGDNLPGIKSNTAKTNTILVRMYGLLSDIKRNTKPSSRGSSSQSMLID